jgi:hypothetical protein
LAGSTGWVTGSRLKLASKDGTVLAALVEQVLAGDEPVST